MAGSFSPGTAGTTTNPVPELSRGLPTQQCPTARCYVDVVGQFLASTRVVIGVVAIRGFRSSYRKLINWYR